MSGILAAFLLRDLTQKPTIDIMLKCRIYTMK